MLTASKGTDDVVVGRAMRQEVLIGPSPAYSPQPQPTIPVQTSNRCVGRKVESYFNKTKRYRPGNGVVNPVVHYQNAATCTESSEVRIYRDYYGMKHVRSLKGQLASFVQQGSTLSLDLPAVPITDVELQALANAIAKATEPKAQLGVTLGELPETINMFRDPLKKLEREGYKFRKLLPRNVRAFSSFVQNAWLGVRYGVMPALSEVDTYRNIINTGLDRAISDLLKEKAGWKSVKTKTQTSFIRDSTIGAWLHGTETVEAGVQVSATAYYRRTRSVNSEALGMDVSSILPTLWELVPYSFVLDWFIDVGGWLQRLCPNNSVIHIGNCLSTKNYVKTTTNVSGASYNSYITSRYPMTALSSQFVLEKQAYSRSVGLTLPAYPLVLRRDLGLARQIDSVLLSLQRVQKLFF